MEMLGFHHHKVPALQQQQQQQQQQQAAAAAAANPRAGFMWQMPGGSRSASGSGVTVAEAAAFFPGGSDPGLMGSGAGHGWPVDHDGRAFTAGLNEDDDDDPDAAPQLFGDPHQQQRGMEGALALSLFDSPNARGHDAGNRMVMWPQQQQQQHQHQHQHHHGTYHNQDQNYPQHHQQPLLSIRYSKYLAPTQDLLYEFCNIGPSVESPGAAARRKSNKGQRGSWEDGGGPSPSSTSNCWNQQQQAAALQSMDAVELQRRKAKLVFMLDEVDRKYRRYCDQMRGVVASFESVAGEGAAAAYSTMASRAMSKHFRCLKDGIMSQIRSIRKAMGEVGGATTMTTSSSTAGNGAADSTSNNNNNNNSNQQKLSTPVPATTAETTPRLKLLDQCFRQQKLFQQGGLMGAESSHPPWRPQRGLPERSVSILRAWLFEHFLHPYPSDVDKHILARQTGLSRSQVSNWFINARVRLWKPMVEEMYLEEQKEQEGDPSSSRATTGVDRISVQVENIRTANPNPTDRHHHHQGSPIMDDNCKPDPDCLSSVVIGSHTLQSSRSQLQPQQQQLVRYGAPATTSVNLDFSSYGTHNHQGFGSNAVSLTLGLQQQGGDGMGISFSPSVASVQGQVLFTSRDGMENCGAAGGGQQAGQYFSVLDGDGQGISLPYRDLMGAQLLHDLAG